MQIEALRKLAIDKLPYMARALLTMQPVATMHPLPAPLVCDTQWNMYYNADDLDAVTDSERIEQYAFAMCVECVRLLQNHAQRLAPLIPEATYGRELGQLVAVTASQYVAQKLLSKLGDTDVHHLTGRDVRTINDNDKLGYFPAVETVAKDILDHLPPMPPGGGNQSGNAEGDPPPPSTSLPPLPSPADLKHKAIQYAQQGAQPNHIPAGSSVDGIPRPWEENYSPDPQRYGSQAPHTIKVGEPPPPTMHKQVRQQVAQVLKKHIGTDAGNPWYDWAQEIEQEHPTVIHHRSLRSLLIQYTQTRMGYNLRRYNGRNRRQQQISAMNNTQFCLPTDCDPHAEIMFVVDTSGSMESKGTKLALEYCATQIQELGLDTSSCLYLGDTEPQLALERITLKAVRALRIDGDGGTNMPRVIEQVYTDYTKRLHRRPPNLLICVTDGGTSWEFEYRPRVPLVVALCNWSDTPWTSARGQDHAHRMLSDLPTNAHAVLVDCQSAS